MVVRTVTQRFYKRWFIVRHDDNQDVINKTDEWLDAYFCSGKVRYMLLPMTLDFARMFGRLPDYFNDLLKQGIMQVGEVTAELGFFTDSVFCVLFKKLRGEMPESLERLLLDINQPQNI